MPSLTAAFLWALLYMSSSAGEVLSLRSLALVPLRLPAFTALLSNQMWVLLLPTYLSTVRASAGKAHTLPLPLRLFQYSICGIITGIITICRNVSINLLPGSVFALLISTSILFSVVLSKLESGAQLNLWHYAAVTCCLGSAMSIALTALLTTQEDVAGSNFPVGIPVALGAAFFVAVMGIAQELYQKTWAGPLFELYLAEMTLASSLVASLFVLLFGAAVGEFTAWAGALATAAAQSSSAQSLIIGVCAILPVLKLAVRNSKYAVILASSSLFFEFVQASAALLSSISSVLAFSEPPPPPPIWPRLYSRHCAAGCGLCPVLQGQD